MSGSQPGFERRKSNRSAYFERSLFGSAIESLFGKDSIFSVLDDPKNSTQKDPNQQPDTKAL